jgi:oxygen-independent coproporphyrinogen-3 oxidase
VHRAARTRRPEPSTDNAALGLYIHIPFCAAICNYCNFNRGLFDAALERRYLDALTREIARVGARQPGLTADTIYFGGGTPSLIEPDEVANLLNTLARVFNVTSDAEVTLEANPETVTVERLAAYRRAGVNRLSLGVQSLRDEELRRLSRVHGPERARGAFAEARAAGFDNVSLDLMMWLPGQRLSQWLESVDEVIALNPEHVSMYLLEVYPGSPLKDEMARRQWSQAPDEDAADMYLEALTRFDATGHAQYEVSNVARPGRRSRHNLKYWTDGEWLGFGCGAHSTRDGVRWKNVSAIETYIVRVMADAPLETDVRRLTIDERIGEAIFMGLRLAAGPDQPGGIDLARINKRYGTDVMARYGAALQPFFEVGWLRLDDDRLWLARAGLLMANDVMAVFV